MRFATTTGRVISIGFAPEPGAVIPLLVFPFLSTFSTADTEAVDEAFWGWVKKDTSKIVSLCPDPHPPNNIKREIASIDRNIITLAPAWLLHLPDDRFYLEQLQYLPSLQAARRIFRVVRRQHERLFIEI